MHPLAVLPLIALALSGCSAATAAGTTVGPETPEELVGLHISDVHEWQDQWQMLGYAEADDWDQHCGALVLKSSFTATSVASSFDRTLYPAIIDGLTDDQRDALIPTVKLADDVVGAAQRWQHMDCQDSPASCLTAAEATADRMDELESTLTDLHLP